MTKISRSTKTLIGIILLIDGLGLSYWAYQKSNTVGSRLNEIVVGSPTDEVTLFYIAGAISIAAGLFFILKK